MMSLTRRRACSAESEADCETIGAMHLCFVWSARLLHPRKRRMEQAQFTPEVSTTIRRGQNRSEVAQPP